MSGMGPSVWDPVPARNLATRAELSGSSIPNPVSGALVFVTEVNDTYRLELASGLPVNGNGVLSTTLGGATRWIRMFWPAFDPLVGGVPINVDKSPNLSGVSANASRVDPKHDVSTAVPVPIGVALSEGVSTSLARADHVHTGGVLPNGAALLWGNTNVGNTTTTRFLTPGFGDLALASMTPIQFRMPFSGTLKNLRVRQNIPNGNGNLIVYRVRVNNVATLILVSMASTDFDGSDLVHSVVVAAGDLIDVEVTKALNVAGAPLDVIAILQVAG